MNFASLVRPSHVLEGCRAFVKSADTEHLPGSLRSFLLKALGPLLRGKGQCLAAAALTWLYLQAAYSSLSSCVSPNEF